MERAEFFRKLASELLNFEGQCDAEEFLAQKELRLAALYICGALDRRVEDKVIDAAEAADIYSKLGLNRDEILKARAGHVKGSYS